MILSFSDVTALADSANKSGVVIKTSKSSEPWTNPSPKQESDVRRLLLQTSAQVELAMFLPNLKRKKKPKQQV